MSPRRAARAFGLALLTGLALAQPAAAWQVARTWGSEGSAPGKFGSGVHDLGGDKRFDSPGGVAIDRAGRVVVADPSNNRLQVFSADGRFVRVIGRSGLAHGRLNNPEGVAIDHAGNIYVADNRNDRVEKFSSRGRYVATVGHRRGHAVGLQRGSERGQVVSPWGLAIGARGDLYVVDQGNARIQVFASNGRLRRAFGGFGAGPGRFVMPYGIATDRAGAVYVTDAATNRILVFSAGGRFLRQFGSTGAAAGQLYGPTGIAISRSGLVAVSDRNGHRIGIWNTAGAFQGSAGEGLPAPTWLAFDNRSHIYVADYRRVVEISP